MATSPAPTTCPPPLARPPGRTVASHRAGRRVRTVWLVTVPLVGAYAALLAIDGMAAGRFPLPVVQLLISAGAAVAAVLLVLLSRRVLRSPYGLRDYGLTVDRGWLTDLTAGLAIGTAAVAIPMGAAIASGGAQIVARFDSGDLPLLPGLAILVAAMLLTGLWEELLLRGVFIRNTTDGLRRRLRSRALPTAVALSALVFGLGHAGQPEHPLLLATWILPGVVFGIVYILSGNLALTIGAHAAFNTASNGLFVRTDLAGTDGLSAIMRIHVDTAHPLLTAGGILDIAAYLLVGALALGWLRATRGNLSPAVRTSHPSLSGGHNTTAAP